MGLETFNNLDNCKSVSASRLSLTRINIIVPSVLKQCDLDFSFYHSQKQPNVVRELLEYADMQTDLCS